VDAAVKPPEGVRWRSGSPAALRGSFLLVLFLGSALRSPAPGQDEPPAHVSPVGRAVAPPPIEVLGDKPERHGQPRSAGTDAITLRTSKETQAETRRDLHHFHDAWFYLQFNDILQIIHTGRHISRANAGRRTTRLASWAQRRLAQAGLMSSQLRQAAQGEADLRPSSLPRMEARRAGSRHTGWHRHC
jgi:hypothetical protein